MSQSSWQQFLVRLRGIDLPATHCGSRFCVIILANVMILIDRGRGYPHKCRNSYLGNVGELTSKFCSRFAIVGVVILLSLASAPADTQGGTLVHEATLHVAPNEDAAKLGQAG